MVFFDTTSTYFEIELPDDHATLDAADGDEPFRVHGHSTDLWPDRPQAKALSARLTPEGFSQVVIGMAVTRGGLPVRLWVWPGATADQAVVARVKADLAGWRLNRVVWITDSGFNSHRTRRIWQRGGSGFILAERLRGSEREVVEARGRQGRYRTVDDTLQVKEIWVGEGPTVQRFIMCRNRQVADRDAAIRDTLVGLLEERIAGSDELSMTKRAELRGVV